MKPHDTKYWIERPLTPDDKDWIDNAPNWIESYIISTNHPHRQLILDEISKTEDLNRILEIGCNTGANLIRIHEVYPKINLVGLDVSDRCINRAREYLPQCFFKVGDYHNMPFPEKYVDLVLCDAVLMYSNPDQIEQAMKEIDRVTKKYVIIIDRWSKSERGVRNGHVWMRNYSLILRKMGYSVKKYKIEPQYWPSSVGWQKYGVVVVGKK